MKTEKIDIDLGNVLFTLWIAGKRFSDLERMFRNTSKSFSYKQIMDYSRRHRWEDRKKKILSDFIKEKKTDETVQIHLGKSLGLMQRMILVVEGELDNYLKDPDHFPRPSWMPATSNEVMNLFKMYQHIISGGVEKTELEIKNSAQVIFDIPEKISNQLLKILSEEKTKKLIGVSNSNSIVDAEVIIENIDANDIKE